jgi:hypothetical protein
VTVVLVVAVGAVLLAQSGVVAYVAHKALRDAPVDRLQYYEFLLRLADRAKAGGVMEVAEAEAFRESVSDHDASVSEEQKRVDDAVRDQNRQGYYGDTATGRAAMVLENLDPSDQEQVIAFNRRFGVRSRH